MRAGTRGMFPVILMLPSIFSADLVNENVMDMGVIDVSLGCVSRVLTS